MSDSRPDTPAPAFLQSPRPPPSICAGGQHKAVEFNVDEYVFAALNLYLDMLNLFVFILSFTGDRR